MEFLVLKKNNAPLYPTANIDELTRKNEFALGETNATHNGSPRTAGRRKCQKEDGVASAGGVVFTSSSSSICLSTV